MKIATWNVSQMKAFYQLIFLNLQSKCEDVHSCFRFFALMLKFLCVFIYTRRKSHQNGLIFLSSTIHTLNKMKENMSFIFSSVFTLLLALFFIPKVQSLPSIISLYLKELSFAYFRVVLTTTQFCFTCRVFTSSLLLENLLMGKNSGLSILVSILSAF